MKNKTSFFLLGLIGLALVVNSCKKIAQSSIENALTSSPWQLASITQTTYLGEAITSTETLNTNCPLTQIFSFSADNSCTYTNFECVKQDTSGKWSLSPDKLILYVDMAAKDTTSVGSSKPFSNSRIINLGLYSMVLETGPVSNYSTTVPRKIRRYGFIRQKTTNK